MVVANDNVPTPIGQTHQHCHVDKAKKATTSKFCGRTDQMPVRKSPRIHSSVRDDTVENVGVKQVTKKRSRLCKESEIAIPSEVKSKNTPLKLLSDFDAFSPPKQQHMEAFLKQMERST